MTPRMNRRTLLGGILGLCGGIPAVALADDVAIFPDNEVIVPPGEEESGCFDADMVPVDCEPVATEDPEVVAEDGLQHWEGEDDWAAIYDPATGVTTVVALPRTGTGH